MTPPSKIPFLVAAVLTLSVPAAQAQFNTPTVSVYDSPNNTNVVDRTAIGNLLTFTSGVATAFNANQGGVINFDGLGTTNTLQNINATYGTNLSKTLSINTGVFNVQFSPNIIAISGTENSGTGLFSLDSVATQLVTYTFNGITGGGTWRSGHSARLYPAHAEWRRHADGHSHGQLQQRYFPSGLSGFHRLYRARRGHVLRLCRTHRGLHHWLHN